MTHCTNLVAAINSHVNEYGDHYLEAISRETELLRRWLEYLSKYEKTECADVLLDGVSTAVIEVAASLTAGFARVALASMRAQIDLVLSWLYFKDHPVEWARLESSGDGFMQKSELIRYLSERCVPSFGAKWNVLNQTRTRAIEDPFSLLSAHLHKQAGSTIVSIQDCAEVVCDGATCEDVIVLQASTTEYVSDVLLVCYAHTWAALPTEIVLAARARLSASQEAVLFS